MAVEIDPSLDYRHWRNDHVSVFPAIHSSFVNYSARSDVIAGLREAGFASFDAINYLSEDGLFRYDAALFSGGGAELDIQKSKAIHPSIWNRRADTVLMSDSGGFQVATGILAPKQYYEMREKITSWQEAISDIAIAMDVPTGSIGNRKAVCIDSFDECLTLTKDNFDWQVQNRNPKAARMLNVVQGLRAEGHEGALRWYDEIKGYCDRSKWGENAFDGWSFGGFAAQNTATALRVIARMLQDGLLGIRRAVAAERDLCIDDELIIKISLFERCFPDAFPALLEMISADRMEELIRIESACACRVSCARPAPPSSPHPVRPPSRRR